jgi:uncharacterized damage-inducible protein DinB
MDDPRYPIGKFNVTPADPISQQQIESAIDDIAALPAQLRAVVSALSAEQLDTPYRDGGWTVRQTVHHIADSHMNSFIRFRLALTEDKPTIKPYNEKDWAELVDARTADAELSLSLTEALHSRWIVMLRAMSSDDFHRVFVHPDYGERRLNWSTLLYAWHGKHHLAHIARLCDRMGWSPTQSAAPARG